METLAQIYYSDFDESIFILELLSSHVIKLVVYNYSLSGKRFLDSLQGQIGELIGEAAGNNGI